MQFDQIKLVYIHVSTNIAHIVAETWFLPSITDSFVDISDYSIVRKDTSSQVDKHGICIYI